MSQTDSGTMFAFGDNELGGAKCPVRSAGLEVSGDYQQLAEQYDHNCSEILDGLGEGVIEESKARRAWRGVIESWQDMKEEATELDQQAYAGQMERKARSIYQNVFE